MADGHRHRSAISRRAALAAIGALLSVGGVFAAAGAPFDAPRTAPTERLVVVEAFQKRG